VVKVTVNLFDEDGGAPSTGRTPAYSSLASLRTLLDTLHENGLPATFDRSFFGGYSGGLIAQTRGTLRFFELIDETNRPTDQLRQLVDADEPGRKAILRRLAEERYPDEIQLSEQSGTHGQLLALMRERGLSGATADKAASFFMHLADYTELPISQYYRQRRSTSAANGPRPNGRRRAGGGRTGRPASQAEVPAALPPNNTLDVKRSAYVDLLMKLADREDGEMPPEELLDRIERALGYQEEVDKPMGKVEEPRPESS
jgi:hypothetical protein